MEGGGGDEIVWVGGGEDWEELREEDECNEKYIV